MRNAGWVGAAATTALRRSSADELASGVARYLVLAERNRWQTREPREVLVGLTPFLDCARRLGEDPAPLFDRAAAEASPELAEIVREFARRDEVTLEAFGWALEDSATGLEYVAL